jgi:hypothetical protein
MNDSGYRNLLFDSWRTACYYQRGAIAGLGMARNAMLGWSDGMGEQRRTASMHVRIRMDPSINRAYGCGILGNRRSSQKKYAAMSHNLPQWRKQPTEL